MRSFSLLYTFSLSHLVLYIFVFYLLAMRAMSFHLLVLISPFCFVSSRIWSFPLFSMISMSHFVSSCFLRFCSGLHICSHLNLISSHLFFSRLFSSCVCSQIICFSFSSLLCFCLRCSQSNLILFNFLLLVSLLISFCLNFFIPLISSLLSLCMFNFSCFSLLF